MSDTSPDGSPDAPPGRRSTPWSVKKIVEQVTGRPLESMQDPPGTRRSPRSSSASSSATPLERFHEDGGPVVAVLAEPEEVPAPRRVEDFDEMRPTATDRSPPAGAGREADRSPSLRAFLPGEPASSSGRPSRAPTLPLTRPLPRQVVEEVEEEARHPTGEEEVPLPPLENVHGHKRSELERVYLTYLLMHLDKLTEPALKYLRHAIEEECEERGLIR